MNDAATELEARGALFDGNFDKFLEGFRPEKCVAGAHVMCAGGSVALTVVMPVLRCVTVQSLINCPHRLL
jgi:hypothetical protein